MRNLWVTQIFISFNYF